MNQTQSPDRTAIQAPAILVVAPAWIGDVVIAQSLFILLRQRYPNARIDVLALAWARPIVARMPEIDSFIAFPGEHGSLPPRALAQTVRQVRQQQYEQAIILRNNIKSALVPFFAGIPRRTGFLGETRYGLLNDIRPLDRSRLTSRVQEYLALGLEAGETPPSQIPYPALRINPQHREQRLTDLGLAGDCSAVAIAPGASFGPAKRWPLSHYIALTRTLIGNGDMVWVLGGEGERPMGEAIVTKVGANVTNLCGRTSLEDAIDLLSASRCMVGADSGLTHVAAATGTRVIGLYGSTSPGYAPPLSDNSTRIARGLACSPCGERQCPLGHTNCMTRIDVASVAAACNRTNPDQIKSASAAPSVSING